MRNTTPAGRRYIARFMPLIAVYVATLFITTWVIRDSQPTGALLGLLSVLPALPLVGIIAVLGLYVVEETDEYLRAQIVRHMMVGLGGLLAIMSIWGFLEFGGAVPHFPTMLGFPIWCGIWGMSQAIGALRNRKSEEEA